MNVVFDPYHRWLGVAPEEQPANHYRLLGIKPLEDNLDVIETAADRQMKHLRDFQSGKHGDASQKLLNEIAAAKVTLLDPAKKQEYDRSLSLLSEQPREPTIHAAFARDGVSSYDATQTPHERPLVPCPLPVAKPFASAVVATNDVFLRPSDPQASSVPARRRSNSSMLIAGGAAALVLVAAIAAVALSMLGDKQPEVAKQRAGSHAQVTTLGDDDAPRNNHDGRPVPVVPPVIPPKIAQPSDSVDHVAETPAPQTSAPAVTPLDDELREDQPLQVSAPQTAFLVGDSKSPKKLPVPDKAAREAKQAEILTIFPVANARTVEERGELARQLLRTARETHDDAAARFALLNLAREQAAEAGHIKLAFETIDALADTFEFDVDAVRVASLQEASKAPIPPAGKRDIVMLGMGLIDAFVVADEFDKAVALSERVVTVARPLRDSQLTKSVLEQRRATDALAAEYLKAKAAFETLKSSPNDPDANLIAGRYLAFAKRDWEAGLSHLAKGIDEPLSATAKLELASPKTAAEWENLADAWWDAAEAEKEKTPQNLARARSGLWYRKALPHLSGLAKAKAEQRIREAPNFAMMQQVLHGSSKRELESVYLDDLQEVDFRVAHTLGKHGHDWDGKRKSTFSGKTPAHSLTTHPSSNSAGYVTYDLNGTAETFEATAGLWEVKGFSAATAITFQIIGDDKVLWESAPLQKLGSGQACRVDIRNVHRLKLQATCPGNATYAVAVWINPRITRYKISSSNEPFTRDPAELGRE